MSELGDEKKPKAEGNGGDRKQDRPPSITVSEPVGAKPAETQREASVAVPPPPAAAASGESTKLVSVPVPAQREHPPAVETPVSESTPKQTLAPASPHAQLAPAATAPSSSASPQPAGKDAIEPITAAKAPNADTEPQGTGYQPAPRWPFLKVMASVGAFLVATALAVWGVIEARSERQCEGASPALSRLNSDYGFGTCDLGSADDLDDAHLVQRIDETLRLAAACPQGAAPDPKRLEFYHAVKLDLEGDSAVCKEAEEKPSTAIWIRLHCLSEASLKNDWKANDGPLWMTLAHDFQELSMKTTGEQKTNAQQCAILSRVGGYHSLAAATADRNATAGILAALGSAGIRLPTPAVQLAAWNVKAYDEPPAPIEPRLVRVARAHLAVAFDSEPNGQQWRGILDRASAPLATSLLGILLEEAARRRKGSKGGEEAFVAAFDELRQQLVKTGKGATSDSLAQHLDDIDEVWFDKWRLAAEADCGADVKRRAQGADRLNDLRAVFGWWSEGHLSPAEVEDLGHKGYDVLFRWRPADEDALHQCGADPKR